MEIDRVIVILLLVCMMLIYYNCRLIVRNLKTEHYLEKISAANGKAMAQNDKLMVQNDELGEVVRVRPAALGKKRPVGPPEGLACCYLHTPVRAANHNPRPPSPHYLSSAAIEAFVSFWRALESYYEYVR